MAPLKRGPYSAVVQELGAAARLVPLTVRHEVAGFMYEQSAAARSTLCANRRPVMLLIKTTTLRALSYQPYARDLHHPGDPQLLRLMEIIN